MTDFEIRGTLYSEDKRRRKKKMLRKIQIRAEYKKGTQVFILEETTEETDAEIIARRTNLDAHHVYSVASSRPCTETEIENYKRENAAADYYSRYGTELEG